VSADDRVGCLALADDPGSTDDGSRYRTAGGRCQPRAGRQADV